MGWCQLWDIGCLVPACVVLWLWSSLFLVLFNEGNVELGANGFSDIIKGGDWLRAKGSLQKFPTEKKKSKEWKPWSVFASKPNQIFLFAHGVVYF